MCIIVWAYEYNIKDHLGNVRVSFKSNSGVLQQVESTNYDPFGIELNGTGTANSVENRFKYQDKESLTLFGLSGINDFGARYYDKTVGRWWGVDALADVSRRHSPYQYNYNNPLRYIDPDGMSSVGADGLTNEQWIQARGNFQTEQELKKDNQEGERRQRSYAFRIGSLIGSDGDLSRQPINGVTGDTEDEASALSSFVNNFNRGIQFESTNDGLFLLNHFLNGTGSPVNFHANSDMARIISENSALKDFVENFGRSVINHFILRGSLEGFDGNGFIFRNRPGAMTSNLFSWTVMGGWQFMRVLVTDVTKTNVRMSITIGDIFGAGRGDANSNLPGLSEMYNLQHNYSHGTRYNPFPWTVNINTSYSK